MNHTDHQPVDTASYWQRRYEQGTDGWDDGGPEPSLMQLFHDGRLPVGSMVVPGCGRGWEVTAFEALGFSVTGIDFAAAPLDALRARARAEGLAPTVLQADIFALPDQLKGQFDVALELACFCAILPEQREAYVAVLDWLLKPGGTLAGGFFTRPDKVGGPPFTVTADALHAYLAPSFDSIELIPLDDGASMIGLAHKIG